MDAQEANPRMFHVFPVRSFRTVHPNLVFVRFFSFWACRPIALPDTRMVKE